MTAARNSAHGCVVGRPQPADGVGKALRSAFVGSEAVVPQDMYRLLAALDRFDKRRC
jgi:hypothetical protein